MATYKVTGATIEITLNCGCRFFAIWGNKPVTDLGDVMGGEVCATHRGSITSMGIKAVLLDENWNEREGMRAMKEF